MIYAALKTVHVLAIILWIGGMAFAHFFLRPAVAQLEAPVRLRLMHDVLGRFLHMGVDAYSFAAALNGIVAQRLLRLNCPHCTRDIEADPEALAACGLTQAAVAGWTLRAGRGCEHCRGIGYKGRRAVAEVLLFDDVLREMLATQAAPSAMRQHAERQGWRSLREIALDWVARGESSLAEVMRVAG